MTHSNLYLVTRTSARVIVHTALYLASLGWIIFGIWALVAITTKP